MVNFARLSPFERIITIFKKAAFAIGAKTIVADFGEFGTYQVDMTKETKQTIRYHSLDKDAGFKYTAEFGIRFWKKREIYGDVFFDGKCYHFKVTHDLWKVSETLPTYTDATGKVYKPGDQFVGETPSIYREAAEVVPDRRDVDFVTTKSKEHNDFTPFYNYVCFSTDLDPDSVIDIHGPAYLQGLTKIAEVKTTQRKVSIYSDDPDIEIPDMDDLVIPPDDFEYQKMRNILYVRYKDIIKPVVFAHETGLVGGIPISPENYLALLKLGCFCEFATLQDLPIELEKFDDVSYVVDLYRAGNDLLIDPKVVSFIHEKVLTTEFIKNLFSEIRSTETAIEAKMVNSTGDGVWVPLVSKMTSRGDFALTVCSFISTLVDGTITSFVGALKSLSEAGGLKAVYDKKDKCYYSEGNSAAYWNGVTRRVICAKGYATVAAKFTSLVEIPEGSGFAIIGFDGSSNVFTNESDHYMLVYVKNKHLYLVYDPYLFTSGMAINSDVTEVFASCPKTERRFYHMEGDGVRSWLNNGDGGLI